MEQPYKVDRHVLQHLDSVEFRINPRVSTKEIKKDRVEDLRRQITRKHPENLPVCFRI